MAISAVKQYNNLMNDICREHLTIGMRLSEGTENWNLADMVCEVQYTLEMYEDPDCLYWQDAHDNTQPLDKPWYKEWTNEKARMKRFIAKYKKAAMEMAPTEGHCSKYG